MPANIPTSSITVIDRNGNVDTLDLPIVTSIEMSMTVSLTEMDTIIYGYENKFIIDLGTVQRYNITMERVNPFPYDDSDDAPPEMWSNGKWYNVIESMLNKWQTLFRSTNGELMGAFYYRFNSSDTELYPNINKTVMLIGTLGVSYKGLQKMEITLPLTVAKLPGATSQAQTMTVTFTSGSGSGASFTREYLVGFSQPFPSVPADWTAPTNSAFAYWTATGSGGIEYRGTPNTNIVWDESTPTTWVAHWAEPLWVQVRTSATTEMITIPENLRGQVTSCVAYAVGGGGGAGGGRAFQLGTTSGWYQMAGGGGASGEARSNRFDILNGIYTIDIVVGAGGNSPDHISISGGMGDDGGNGGESSVTYNRVPRVTAAGGAGGKGANATGYNQMHGGAGGVGNPNGGSYSGGSAGATWDVAGEDGLANLGIAGQGHASHEETGQYGQGGAGGGAADIYGTFDAISIRSVGGNGGMFVTTGSNRVAPTQPAFGGGAGSGGWDNPPNGADGVVVLMFFGRD